MREPSLPSTVRRQPRVPPCARGLLAAGLFLCASLAHANVILVAASAVSAGGNACSLVDAINAANNNAATGACPAGDDQTSGGDVIVLAAGTYKVASVDNDWYGPNGLPPITSKITIVGDPKGTVIMRSTNQGEQAFRLFFIGGGQSVASNNPPSDFSTLPGPGNLTLVNLTLENGLAQGGAGGASAQGSAGGGLGAGGALYNQGTLTLEGVTLVGNQALGGAAGGSSSTSNSNPGGGGGMAGGGDSFGNGGGFSTNGAWPDSTTPSGEFGNGGGANQAGGVGGGGGSSARGGYGGGGGGGGVGAAGGFGGGSGGIGTSGGFGGGSFLGGGGGMGGAIFNEGGTLTLVNCTLTGNNAGGGAGSGLLGAISNGQALGGAIFNLNGSVTISYSTLADNTLAGTAGDGGSIYSKRLANPGSPAANARSSASVSVSSSILFGSELNTTDSSGNVTSAAATDCFNDGGTLSGGSNLVGSTSISCILSGDTSTSLLPPLPLANNGGPTQTMQLVVPIGTGIVSGAPPLDQRGYLRNAIAPEIGAYEISSSRKSAPAFSGLQRVTLIAGSNAALAWFNLTGNDSTQPALSLSTLSSNTTVLPAANLALSANCGASLSLDTCSLGLTPTATKTGSGNVTLIATNGYGQTGYGSFAVTVIPPIPVAKDAAVSVASGQTLNGNLSATDSLQVIFSYSIVAQPAHGTLKLSSPNGSSYTYTPATGYIGADSFTWQANDGSSDSNVATVSITVTLPPPPLGAPTVSNMSLSTAENTPLSGTLQASGASLSFAIATQPAHGKVNISNTGTGAFTYKPATGYTGADSFTFTAESTLLKATSNPATVNITVSAGGSGSGSGSGSGGPNSAAPLASAMTLATYAGTTLSSVLTASDAAGNPMNFTVTAPSHGSVKLTNAATGAFSYTPATGYTGADGFTFTAIDSVTGLGSAATAVSLTVKAVPVSATAVPLASNGSFTTYVDVAIDGTLSASDAAGNPLTYTLANPPTHGTVVITAASGAFVYTPATGYTGSDSFSFTATDTVTNVASAAATVALTMDALPPPTPSPPVANAASYTSYENIPVSGTLTASSASGGPLSYSPAGTAATAHGSVTIAAGGAFTYTPASGYIGSDSFSFTASSSNGPSAPATVTLTVSALPPPAPVAGTLTLSTYAGVPVTAVLPASDGAGNAISYTVVTPTAHGSPATPVINSDGSFTYTPAAGFTGGNDSLSYTVTDSTTLVVSAPATVNFSVIAPPTSGNATPLANNSSVTLYENRTLSSILSGAVSPAADGATFSVVTQPRHSTAPITPAANGAFTYTPTANFTGADAFTFTVKDGVTGAVSTTASVVITVASSTIPVTPPQASGASYSLFAGQALNGTLAAVNTSGSANLSYAAVQPGHGTLTVTASGTGAGNFTYTPNAGYTGSDSFAFTAIDGSGAASTPATVALTVAPLPIAGVPPLANGGSLALYAGQPASGKLAAVDAAANPLSYTAQAQPGHGALKISAATGTYTYTPAAGYTGKDSFSFTATDTVTHLASSAATVNITVAALPLAAVAPLANDLNLTLYAGQAFSSVLSAIDVNGNPIDYAITTQPQHGAVSLTAASGAFRYTPAGGYSGNDSFAYTATDSVSKLASSAATANLTIVPAPPGAVHHGGPGRGGYGPLYLLLLGMLVALRRLRRFLPPLGALALLWAAAAAADGGAPAPAASADAWYGGGQINLIKPDGKRDAATHGPRGWGILAGKERGDFSLEFSGQYHADNPKDLGGLANWKTLGVDGLWYFNHRSSQLFSPFADAGLGFANEYYGDGSKLHKAYLALGAGFDSAPWQSLPLYLRTDLQLQHVLGSYNDLVLSFGLGVRFGGSVPPAPPLALPDASPLDKYPMAWCAQEGGEPQQTDSGWVCILPGGHIESRPESAAPPAGTLSSPSAVTYAPPPATP